MNALERIHGGYVFPRRVQVLARHFAELIPQNARVLDVGCGDGTITKLVCDQRPDVRAEGIDVLVREQTHIPVKAFDGRTIPHPDASFDAVIFIDVLHHTEDPTVLLREAKRVAKQCIVIKDHTRDGMLAGPTLKFMDKVGNARFGVVLPFNYWPEARWREAFGALQLNPAVWRPRLGLYPWPASWLFDRSLHFIARLDIAARG